MADNYEIQKWGAEIRRGIEDHRDYAYCKEFLDRLSEQTEELVGILVPMCSNLERLKALLLRYVDSVCSGLECAEGHREDILGPRPFNDVADIAKELRWMANTEYWNEGPVFKTC